MGSEPTSILVIDNHPMMRASLCAVVDAENDFFLLQPGTGQESMAVSISDEYDVIFLSQEPEIILIGLGNQEGEVAALLAALRTKMPHAAILALVSGEQAGQEEFALSHGAHAVLPLSASRSRIIQVLHAIKQHTDPTNPSGLKSGTPAAIQGNLQPSTTQVKSLS